MPNSEAPNDNTICVYEILVDGWVDRPVTVHSMVRFEPNGTDQEKILLGFGRYWTNFAEACDIAEQMRASNPKSSVIVVEKLLQRCY